MVSTAGERTGHHVRALLRQGGFRRLYATRLTGQLGDGIFQASLATAKSQGPLDEPTESEERK